MGYLVNKDLISQKLDLLEGILQRMGSCVVAFSGGVDSSFLLKIAFDTLGNKVLAVTATSPTYPKKELEGTMEVAKGIGVRHLIIRSAELDIKGFRDNPVDRCYFCKKELFSELKEIANKEGLSYILDGSNYDDLRDFRPGRKAKEEFGVRSPLLEAGLKKDEIRSLSQKVGLPTWNKPQFACLASRFPYFEEITEGKLRMVEEAEDYLQGEGIRQIRVRHHNHLARIEVLKEDIEIFLDPSFREKVTNKLRQIGYDYITLDLQGYRAGSMNEIL